MLLGFIKLWRIRLTQVQFMALFSLKDQLRLNITGTAAGRQQLILVKKHKHPFNRVRGVRASGLRIYK